MSTSSPFRVPGDHEYRWPPETICVEPERLYPRVSTVLKGEPKERVADWRVGLVADEIISNTEAISEALHRKEAPGVFSLNQEWWNETLDKAERKDIAQDEKRERWDAGDIFQKTQPKWGGSVERLLSLSQEQRVNKYLRAIPGIALKIAQQRGTAVHQLLERHTLGEDFIVPSELQAHFENGVRFLADFCPDFLEIESVIYSDTYGYAGQFDWLARIPTAIMRTVVVNKRTGELWEDKRDRSHPSYDPSFITVMGDYKTGDKGIKASIALQLSAYAFGDFIGRVDGTKDPLPHIDEYWGVSVRADDYEVIPVAVNEDTWKAFLHIRGTERWIREQAPKVLGKPLQTRAA